MPEIIFSYSSLQGMWLSFLAFSSSCVFFVVAAIVMLCVWLLGGKFEDSSPGGVYMVSSWGWQVLRYED